MLLVNSLGANLPLDTANTGAVNFAAMASRTTKARKDALLQACENAGGQTALARKLKLKSQGAIANWLSRGRVPAERVLDVETVTGVSRHDLRPDLYPRESAV